jgi:hypothetical protein
MIIMEDTVFQTGIVPAVLTLNVIQDVVVPMNIVLGGSYGR